VTDAFRLDGRVAVVTAASRGIGAEIAATFADAGAHVVLAARGEDALQSIASRIATGGGTATPVIADVTTDAGIELVGATARDLGHIDILVNTVGGAEGPQHRRVTLRDATRTDFAGCFDFNVTSHFLMSRAVLQELEDSGHGSIINVSSAGARPYVAPLPHGLYGAAKAALTYLSMQMAQEWAPAVRVNSLLPGQFTTSRNHLLDDAGRSVLLDRIALKRTGELSEVAHAALFLASDAASYITGTALEVSGGMGLVPAYMSR
jgi:7-alpha-hydroxysteroid dehydrogenase